MSNSEVVFTDPLANGESGDITPEEMLALLPPDGFQDIDPEKHDWSFLDQADESIDDEYDPNATLEEEEARKAARAERLEAEQANAQQSQGDPPTEEKTAPDNDLTKKAELWDNFAQMVDKDPASLVKIAFDALPEAQKAAALKALGVAPAAAAPAPQLPDLDTDNFVPVGELEEALVPRWQDIKSIPELRQQVTELQSSLDARMDAKVNGLQNPIGTAAVHGEIALAMIAAISEAMELNLEMPDMGALSEILKDGRTTFRSAVQKLTGEKYKKSLAEYKQGRAARPTTPGASSTHAPRNNKNTDMVSIYRELNIPFK